MIGLIVVSVVSGLSLLIASITLGFYLTGTLLSATSSLGGLSLITVRAAMTGSLLTSKIDALSSPGNYVMVKPGTTKTISVDGIVLVSGDLILLRQEQDIQTNGIYQFDGNVLTRYSKMNSTDEFIPGLMVYVKEGNDNGGISFILTQSGTFLRQGMNKNITGLTDNEIYQTTNSNNYIDKNNNVRQVGYRIHRPSVFDGSNSALKTKPLDPMDESRSDGTGISFTDSGQVFLHTQQQAENSPYNQYLLGYNKDAKRTEWWGFRSGSSFVVNSDRSISLTLDGFDLTHLEADRVLQTNSARQIISITNWNRFLRSDSGHIRVSTNSDGSAQIRLDSTIQVDDTIQLGSLLSFTTPGGGFELGSLYRNPDSGDIQMYRSGVLNTSWNPQSFTIHSSDMILFPQTGDPQVTWSRTNGSSWKAQMKEDRWCMTPQGNNTSSMETLTLMSSNARIGIRTSSPETELHVTGALTLSALNVPSVPTSSDTIRMFVKSGKLVIQTSSEYIILDSSNATWSRSTSPP